MKMYQWHGVVTPKGHLEAVEESPEMARYAAINLSPDKQNPNRAVVPVTVIVGSRDDVEAELAVSVSQIVAQVA